MRKMGTSYEHSMKDIYLPSRTNNYLNEQAGPNATKLMGNRLRRLQSFQV